MITDRDPGDEDDRSVRLTYHAPRVSDEDEAIVADLMARSVVRATGKRLLSRSPRATALPVSLTEDE